jgi:DNA-directed RNA polymerase specialized sigma24 family protein
MEILDTLPPGYKMVFNLYAIEGYGHREIAQMLGCSEGTSKSQLSRARAHLQRSILQVAGQSENNISSSLQKEEVNHESGK